MRVAASAGDDMSTQSKWFGPESVPFRVQSHTKKKKRKEKDLLSDNAVVNKGHHLQSTNCRIIHIYLYKCLIFLFFQPSLSNKAAL